MVIPLFLFSKKMTKENKENISIRGFYFMILVIILIFLAFTTFFKSNNFNYMMCTDACSGSYFMGIKKGDDLNLKSCYVNEFDRTDCIDNCRVVLKNGK